MSVNSEYKYLPVNSIGERIALIQLFIFIPFAFIFLLFCYLSIDKIIKDSINDALSSALYKHNITTDNTVMIFLAIIFFIIGSFILAFSLFYFFRIKKIKKKIIDKVLFVGLKVNTTEIIDFRLGFFKINYFKILKSNITSIDCRMYKGYELIKITSTEKILHLRPHHFGLSGSKLIEFLK